MFESVEVFESVRLEPIKTFNVYNLLINRTGKQSLIIDAMHVATHKDLIIHIHSIVQIMTKVDILKVLILHPKILFGFSLFRVH